MAGQISLKLEDVFGVFWRKVSLNENKDDME